MNGSDQSKFSRLINKLINMLVNRQSMLSKLFLAFLAGLILSFSWPVKAGSPVWRIEHDGAVVFVAGTIHVLADADYPLPTAFDMAYQSADRLVFETDIDAMSSPDIGQKMLLSASYTGGRRLQDDLSPDTYQQVETFFAERGIPMTQMSGLKPGMISIVMTLTELQRLGQAGTGVDEFFYERAREDMKARDYLESVDMQIGFLADLGVGQEDEFIRYTLRDLADLPTLWRDLKVAWRSGDLTRLDKLAGESMREDFPAVYRDLVVERNRAWIPKLNQMLHSEEVELVLVGALHLAGPDGLIEHFMRRGYQVTPLP